MPRYTVLSLSQRSVRDSAIVASWKQGNETITEIAKRFNISRDTVYRAIRAAGLDTTPRASEGQVFASLKQLRTLEERVQRLEEWRASQRITFTSPNYTATAPLNATYHYSVQ